VAVRGSQYAPPVDLDKLPPYVPKAFIAIEDRWFYWHFGFNPWGIVRSQIYNMTHHGGSLRGGSTITQQLARNLFLTPNQTYRRKAQELILAMWLEARFSKKQVLELMRSLARPYQDVPEAHIAVAQAAWNAEDHKLAVSESAAALKLRPDWELAALFQARTVTLAGTWACAGSLLSRATTVPPVPAGTERPTVPRSEVPPMAEFGRTSIAKSGFGPVPPGSTRSVAACRRPFGHSDAWMTTQCGLATTGVVIGKSALIRPAGTVTSCGATRPIALYTSCMAGHRPTSTSAGSCIGSSSVTAGTRMRRLIAPARATSSRRCASSNGLRR